MTTSILQDRAMLATLHISQWTNRKHDKTVSAEVERNHQATDAGRYNKQLVDRASLESIAKVASAARAYHYKVTLPWGDNGDRLLPGALFMDYRNEMATFKGRFSSEVSAFLTRYPMLVQDAYKRLGSLYVATDYPHVGEMRSRFAIETSFAPVASGNDFRVNLNDEYVDQIKREINERNAALQRASVVDCWTRVRTVVGNIHERLSKADNKFKDTLIENARDLLDVLPALNVTGDPELAKIEKDVRDLLVPPQRLRDDATLRSETARKAEELLARMGMSGQSLSLETA